MEQLEMIAGEDTIAAISTPAGVGGIAVIRVSGPRAIAIVDSAWKGKKLSDAESHTVHLGRYFSTDGDMLDECVATIFKVPNSFTGEDVVELSVHGSKWIQREVLTDLIRRGVRTAEPGEFTRRAYLNGRLDLAQAEGVADLIASSSRAAHKLAVSQTRGNFSKEFNRLRDKLIDFASLLELELDFSEEDVEFADRAKLLDLSNEILEKINRLIASYSSGSVLKEGVPVVIAGVPNAGKSSLLNLLLNDDKAIISDIPGTTRDSIEDTVELNGILYRFIDTAGLRESADTVEKIGIERARKLMKHARIVIWLLDPTSPLAPQQEELTTFIKENPAIGLIVLANKADLLPDASHEWPLLTNTNSRLSGVLGDEESNGNQLFSKAAGEDESNSFRSDGRLGVISFSTKTGEGMEALNEELDRLAKGEHDIENEIMVTNARHYESLVKGAESLRRAINGLETGLSGDFIAQDVRETLHHLGTITGAITTPTLLQTIFSRFCIGK